MANGIVVYQVTAINQDIPKIKNLTPGKDAI
jgi:hypothetical protein